jgi:DNA-directed RNA polymerase subunit M/transcription elongation factor TFIIS
MFTEKQLSTATQQSQATTKVASGLKCPDCREKAVSVKVVRGAVNAGSAKCHVCGWSVRVAQLSDGIVAKCPCCGSFAFPALGWRSGKQPFVALACDACGWVASETYMQVVSILLSTDIYAATNPSGNGQSDQVHRESDHAIDGVPAPFEAALQAFYRGDQPVCPFCGQRYRELEAERIGFGEIIVVTLLRCGCGVFPVKAEVLRD